jgi:hypothetical protein
VVVGHHTLRKISRYTSELHLRHLNLRSLI